MAKPKLALIPATQGSKLYSVLPADGVGDFTFSRNSVATRINKDGLIETVAVGKSRLNYPLIDGVVNGCPSHLLEPSRTNLITYSNNFDGTNMINSAIITEFNTTETLSPEGINNASKLTANSAFQRYSFFPTAGDNVDVSCSVFAKKGSASIFSTLIIDKSGQPISTKFDLLNGVIVEGGGSIEDYGNGWYKCSFSGSTSSGATALQIRPFSHGSGFENGWTGSNYIYGFGASLEQGSYATSYIPTSGSTVTRSAETANGAGDASTFNDSEGVLMAEISALTNSGGKWISLSNGSTSQRISFANENGNIRVYIFNGVVIWDYIYYNINTITSNKISLKYKSGDYSLFINGFKINTSTSSLVASGIDSLQFNSGGGSGNFEGNTKQIQYFDTALNDSDLETITSWTSFTDMANGQTYSIK